LRAFSTESVAGGRMVPSGTHLDSQSRARFHSYEINVFQETYQNTMARSTSEGYLQATFRLNSVKTFSRPAAAQSSSFNVGSFFASFRPLQNICTYAEDIARASNVRTSKANAVPTEVLNCCLDICFDPQVYEPVGTSLRSRLA
jgi:hypothetical protein